MFLKPPARLFTVSILCVAVVLTGCEKKQAAGQPQAVDLVKVGTYTMKAQELTMTTDLPGRTVAFRVAEVRPQVNGILQKRLFTEGTDVKQGQQLYQIDPATYQAQLDKAKANLIAAELLAKRYQALQSTKAISQQQYDDAYSAWQQAKADVEVAKINVVYTKVLSPISGRIGRSLVTEGALVTNGQAQALATVQQLDPIYVDITQSMTDILKLREALKKGQLQTVSDDAAQVSLELENGQHYPLTGTLGFSEVSVDQGTGSVVLRATFPNPDYALLPGMFVHAKLQTGVNKEALLVPQQAVSRNVTGKPFVWVVADDGSAEQRTIVAPGTIGNTWLVTSGLKSGEKVVAEGLQRMRPGVTVEATEASNIDIVTDYASSTAGNSSAQQNQ